MSIQPEQIVGLMGLEYLILRDFVFKPTTAPPEKQPRQAGCEGVTG
jgi:hypothetical protein